MCFQFLPWIPQITTMDKYVNIKKCTEMLTESAKQLHETEENAMAIEESLYKQRKTINNIQNNLKEQNSVLDSIDKTVQSMSRRQKIMKFLW